MDKKIITISRQCGSGGHTLGKQIAEHLNIPFYDKRIVEIVAERSGLSERTVAEQGEYATTSLLYSLATKGYIPSSVNNRSEMRLPDQVNAYQTELIKELAEKDSCVIVGRCADYILRDRSDCFHVFISGGLQDRAQRVVREHNISPDEAETHVLERDKKRSRYYKHITDQTWGMAENYHLCLNSSILDIEQCVDMILRCINAEN